MKTTANIYDILIDLVNYYKNEDTEELAKIMIERNRGFYLIKKFEENELSNLLLPNIRYNKRKDIFEFDLNKDGEPNKYGLVTTETTRQRGLSLLSRLVYKSKELPKDLIEEAKNFVIKKGKPVGLDEDDLILSVSFCLLVDDTFTNMVNSNDKKSKIWKKLIKDYYGNSGIMSVKEIINKKKKKINKNIKSITNKNKYLLFTDNNQLNFRQAQSLAEYEMLNNISKKSNSKINKAFSVLI